MGNNTLTRESKKCFVVESREVYTPNLKNTQQRQATNRYQNKRRFTFATPDQLQLQIIPKTTKTTERLLQNTRNDEDF